MEELFKYIRKQPEDFVINLISDQDACRTYIRLLPPLSQQILFRLLYIERGFPRSEVEKWSPKSKSNDLINAIKKLIKAHLVYIVTDTISENSYNSSIIINKRVREVLLGTYVEDKKAFVRQKNPFAPDDQPDENFVPFDELDQSKFPTIDEKILDDFSNYQLESILSFMLKLRDNIDNEAKKILSDAKLMEFGGNLCPKGHRFLLLSPKEQIWRIVKCYLKFTKDLHSSLRFLLKIGSMELSKGYPITSLTPTQKELLSPFKTIGLVYIDGDYFYPTKSILNFFGKSNIFQTEGWMLIDTNFKITAFPKSPLHTALLKKFANVTYEFPGFASAFISPNSFREALNQGTTLDDIIGFLKSNLSHKIGSGQIPSAVMKQFYVWRDQRERLTVTHECIMRQYTNPNDANLAAQCAKQLAGYVYGPAEKKESHYWIVITLSSIEQSYKPYLDMIQNNSENGGYI
ncbi:hypothetical protein TVAG_212420 [Trichomonas vaginalis G3]|uniref:General transcription factor IIH subunit 4 n=1 Tax=Trichomonas vaginalis (strain ATCC PRA-98 / G3) TaxID=412133 RepID=A2E2N2_TRIV3|nr:phosphorylation of RNA polymerase II C-terminal domain [Trichomonas vaginalis G3]EAY13060.1 hypothetical protein TVAG_212420 [Trichomonas vaginalis G3]KAI5548248.1 phosphorylation of RNA polymerase II C-terminal domain [Trichomonas vaginalis G3]|eukprot:XP_001325283.1 hypothetical protein [Trichomonas vaginalis G3]